MPRRHRSHAVQFEVPGCSPQIVDAGTDYGYCLALYQLVRRTRLDATVTLLGIGPTGVRRIYRRPLRRSPTPA